MPARLPNPSLERGGNEFLRFLSMSLATSLILVAYHLASFCSPIIQKSEAPIPPLTYGLHTCVLSITCIEKGLNFLSFLLLYFFSIPLFLF